MMADKKERDISIEELKWLRDEIKLQLHLASKEARDEWDKLEEKWRVVNDRLRSVGYATTQSVDEIGEAAKATVREVENGYERIKKAL